MDNVKRVINNDVIRWLEEASGSLNEQDLVLNPELNALLDRVRTARPIKLKCDKSRCETVLAYLGLASGHSARVIPGPKRKPRGKRSSGTYPAEGTYRPGRQPIHSKYVVGGAADLVFPDFGREGRFDEAIEYGQRGEGAIRCVPNPEVSSGWPLKWEFHCPGPGIAHYEFTNSALIRMFATAVQWRQDTIRAGRLY